MRELARDGLPERRDSIEARINVVTVMNGFDCALNHRRWDLGIADSLREVDSPDAVAFHGHRADLRLHDARRNFAQAQLFCCGSHAFHLITSLAGATTGSF